MVVVVPMAVVKVVVMLLVFVMDCALPNGGHKHTKRDKVVMVVQQSKTETLPKLVQSSCETATP